MRRLSVISLFSVLLFACHSRQEEKLSSDNRIWQQQGIDSAKREFANKKFTWLSGIACPLSYYAEEVLWKRYRLDVTIPNDIEINCGTGLPEQNRLKNMSYFETIDSLMTRSYGAEINVSLLYAADRLRQQYPGRYEQVDRPVFPGGDSAFHAEIQKQIHFPPDAARMGGTVILVLNIDSTGKVTYARVKQSLREDLDSIAIAGVKTLPAFQPAFRRGRKESSVIVQPVEFVLR